MSSDTKMVIWNINININTIVCITVIDHTIHTNGTIQRFLYTMLCVTQTWSTFSYYNIIGYFSLIITNKVTSCPNSVLSKGI